ncbi:MAG: right-handed parallel beta-helix repeat-containing protein [Thermoplasmata archaeon]|nr:right-handed parallel beta-helix repeat-containing protein [Thermoplasmata archaeon]
MYKRTTLFLALFIVGTAFMGFLGPVKDGKAARTWIVDQNGNGDFTSIQTAINFASSGDTIYVWDGTYNENIRINKRLSVIGNGTTRTIIDGGGSGDVVDITADGVKFSGFTVRNSGSSWGDAGIEISGSNCEVYFNNITGNTFGIHFTGEGGIIANNIIINNSRYGLYSSYGSELYIQYNIFISDNVSISLISSDFFLVMGNIIRNSRIGIHSYYSSGTRYYNDYISSNSVYNILISGYYPTFVNCTVINSSTAIVLQNNAWVTFLNTTYTGSPLLSDAYSVFTVKWYLHLNVKDTSGLPVSNGVVEVKDSAGTEVYRGSTDINGRLKWIQVTEFTQKRSGIIRKTPHSIVVYKEGYYNTYTEEKMDTTKEVPITMEPMKPRIDVDLLTGLQYNSRGAEYSILASVTKCGEPLQHTTDTSLLITIYDEGLNKVVDKALMDVLDSSAGLYKYTNTTTKTGVFYVIVNANISGRVIVGTTTFEVVEWIDVITNINRTVSSINDTVNDIQERAVDIQSTLDALQDNMLEALSDLENISDKEDSVLEKLAEVNASLYSEIQNLLATVTVQMNSLNSSLSSQLLDLLNNITSDHNALRDWLMLVLTELSKELNTTNQTLHAELDSMSEMMSNFYEELRLDLLTLMNMLRESEDNLTKEINELNDTINHLNELTLSELRERLDDLSESLSSHNTEIGQKLYETKMYIASFENRSSSKLDEINTTLLKLSELNTILANLEDLNNSLNKSKRELSSSIDTAGRETKSKLNMQMVVLIVILILLVVLVVQSFMGRSSRNQYGE